MISPECLWRLRPTRLETHQGHVHHRHGEGFEQLGHKHLPLTETRFYGEPTLVLAVVELLTYQHVIVKLADDLTNRPRHVETGEYIPRECSDDEVVRFDEIA